LEILNIVFGSPANRRSAARQRSMPAASRSTGLAQWLTMKIWSGKAAATRANSSACGGIDHRLQMQPVPADGADAREPPRILHQIGARGEPLGRVGVPS
jgi:hypothetical protein